MTHLAQVDLGPLMQNLGAAGWAVVLVVMGFILRELGKIREEMVTKDGLALALHGMRKELDSYIEGRFQTKEDARSAASGNIRDHLDIRKEISDIQREADSH